MNVFEAVQTVLAVRDYRSDPVPDEILRRIVEAGRLSASAQNRQPWHFVVVDDPETIGRLAEVTPTGPYIANAPVVIVVAVAERKVAESDASRAIQNMILTAWSEGIGSNWVGFRGPEGVAEIVGLPNDLKVLALLPLGYPAGEASKGIKKRKPLEEVASRNRYGRPFA